jgi:tRNA/rRNA methyltransferase
MQLHFILVDPARGENVGFTARALKTMGFSSLRIVGKMLQHTVAARKTGYGSHDLLDQVAIYTSWDEATAGMDLIIGTTSKKRIKRYDAHTPQQLHRLLNAKEDMLHQVGLVFGSEENGLSTKQLDGCDLISTIPLATDYPSLNLAQSALIYAWELSRLPQHKPAPNTHLPLQKLLMDEVSDLLIRLGISDKPLLARRIMDRVALLNKDDSQLLMSVLSKLDTGAGNDQLPG